ncbi:MAG: hypothetical protein KBS76_07845 [Ruminococcus sp.]|nr:hypothetical protein [Candidatus Apopatosoma intestinale]
MTGTEKTARFPGYRVYDPITFSKRIRLSAFRNDLSRLSKLEKKRESGEMGRFLSMTLPAVLAYGMGAAKAIEQSGESAEEAAAFLTFSSEIYRAVSSNLTQENLEKALEKRKTGAGYECETLNLLPSGLVVAAVSEYAADVFLGRTPSGSEEAIRRVRELDFDAVFHRFCAAEQVLADEKADIVRFCGEETKRKYLHEISLGAKQRGIGEAAYASELCEKAAAEDEHVGKYLLPYNPLSGRVYFVSLFSFTALFILLLGFLCGLSAGPSILLCLLSAVPIYEFTKKMIRRFFAEEKNGFLPSISSPEKLKEHQVLVTLTTLLLGEKHDAALFDRLEDYYLTNPEDNYFFAVLGDFRSSDKRTEPGDTTCRQYAQKRIDALCRKYGNRFFLLTRDRRFCKSEGEYMGWERKRGAILELSLMLRGKETGIRVYGDGAERLQKTEYILTLDEDTKLRIGGVSDLLGIMIHPCNRPVVDRKRRTVVAGHAVVAPQMNIGLSSAYRTPFAWLFTGGGTDRYSGTSFDVYQDVFDAGSFCGKGMIDVDAYTAVIPGFFRTERILSHDLLEGNLLRGALASCMAFIDSTPSDALRYYSREERWMRGDIQALSYAGKTVIREDGTRVENPMNALCRYKIADNVVRESAPLFSLILLFLSPFFGTRAMLLFSLFSVLYLIWPMISFTSAVFLGKTKSEGRYFSGVLSQGVRAVASVFWNLSSLAYDAYAFFVTSVLTVYRMTVSHRYLLAWKTAAQSEQIGSTKVGILFMMLPSFVTGAIFLAVPALIPRLFAVLSILYPVVMAATSDERKQKVVLTEKKKKRLAGYARDMWQFFSDNVTAETHFLPPDNIQFLPEERIARRTSPTNIGLYLLSLLSARDFGFLDSRSLHTFAERTGKTLSILQKWNGHLYNWYDTDTLSVIGEPFISSVDSGNLVTAMVAFCEGLREYASECSELIEDVYLYEDLIRQSDFAKLYCPRKKCFFLGYHVGTGRYSDSYYDTFMSEFRTTAYYAVAARFAPPESYYSLSRLTVEDGAHLGLASWSGTAFEFFMPELLLPSPRGGIVCEALDFAYDVQSRNRLTREVGGKKRSLFGVSECGYYLFDYGMNYQYHAFGLRSLGLDPAMTDGFVIAPYASFLMLSHGHAVFSNFKEMQLLGAYGKYGFYEAIDMDGKRVGEGYAVIRSYMAHHVGMSIVSCANACFDNRFQERFLRNPLMRASSEMLGERFPIESKPAPKRKKLYEPREPRPHFSPVDEEKTATPNYLVPGMVLLTNGKSRVICSSSGHMALYNGRDVLFRSDFEPFTLGGGLRVLFLIDGEVYTVSPLGKSHDSHRGEFEFLSGNGFAEYRAVYRNGGLTRTLSLRISVCPNREIFDLAARINGPYRHASVCLYGEPVLETESSFCAHRSFSNLFLESRFDEDQNILLFSRRPRNDHKPFRYLGILCSEEDGIAYDTMRDRFLPLGYGDDEIAAASLYRPTGSVGTVLIPACRLVAGYPKPGEPVTFSLPYYYHEEDMLFDLSHRKRGNEKAVAEDILRLQAFSADYRRDIMACESLLLPFFFGPRQIGNALPRSVAETFAQNPFRREELWPLGISGDNPVVLIKAEEHSERDLISLADWLLLFRYVAIRGIRFDLVVLYEETDFYHERFRRRLLRMTEKTGLSGFLSSDNGIFFLCQSRLSERVKNGLGLVAVLSADCRLSPASAMQSERRQLDFENGLLEPMKRPAITSVFDLPEKPAVSALETVGGGVFHENGFLFDKPHVSIPWSHVLSGYGLGTVVTDNSLGFSFMGNAMTRRLTAHTADNMTEDRGEKLILRIFESDLQDSRFCDYDLIACAKTVDYRFSEAVYYGSVPGRVRYSVSVRVEEKYPAKIISLFLKNTESKPLVCTAAYCVYPDFGIPGRFLRFSESSGKVRVDKLADYGGGPSSLFLGIRGNDHPVIYTEKLAFGSDGHLVLGTNDMAAVAESMTVRTEKKTVFTLSATEAELPDHTEPHKEENGIQLISGDPLLNVSVNEWLLYQTKVSRVLARSGFYQISGAYGYRDQLQDVLSLIYEEPALAKIQIMRCAAHQFEEGDVMHWWHPSSDSDRGDAGVRTRCSDDMLWLPYACAVYAEKTGDTSVFSVPIPYLCSPVLTDREKERYERVPAGRLKEPIYRHCIRAIDLVLSRMGSHGLPLIGECDWNDGMNAVGAAGRGESVWLGEFLILVLRAMKPAFSRFGEISENERFFEEEQKLIKAVWACYENGQFLRGIYDDGSKLGAKENGECSIDGIAQAFAAFCFGKDERTEKAMHAVYDRLYREEEKLVCLLTPPFVSDEQSPGYIKGYPAGIRENGGQYTHAAVWMAMGFFAVGDHRTGTKLLMDLNPSVRLRDEKVCRRYQIEPYVMAGDVYTNSSHPGRGGWSWYTGASGWYRRAVLEVLCGYRQHGGGFQLSPHLSDLFPSFSLEVKQKNTAYHLNVSVSDADLLTVDGEEISTVKPIREYFFPFDGGDHMVSFRMKMPENR